MKNQGSNRRQFVQRVAAASALVVSPEFDRQQQDADSTGSPAPAVHTPNRSGSTILVGNDDHRFEVEHDFLNLPAEFSWQVTHNIATDRAGNIYVIHQGEKDKPDHPAIFVFDSSGNYLRSFGNNLQGGGHGLEIREENGEEFIYASAFESLKFITKLTLSGETVWIKKAPMESGLYADNEAENPDGSWGRDRFMPTNFAFSNDGGFLVADGYGSWTIQRYDAEGNFDSHFGRPGTEDGQFDVPHGIAIDPRETDADGNHLIIVADRANMRLQWFGPTGEHVRTQDDFLLPASVDVQNDLLLVAELQSQITILDGDNNKVAILGADEDWRELVQAESNALRKQPDKWQPGKFLHPHDACFDSNGNILVAEWVQGGRITRLKRV